MTQSLDHMLDLTFLSSRRIMTTRHLMLFACRTTCCGQPATFLGRTLSRRKKNQRRRVLLYEMPEIEYSTSIPGYCRTNALTSTAREVTREPQSQISGFTFLDDKRASSIFIQPSLPSFCGAFETISDGLLKGLDWSNVFVAGGIILGTLLSTTPERQKEFIHSDIDVYIYGLSASAANDKIAHIYETWKSNLPPNTPSAVVRNSRTITFFAKYPIKRVQIVMKLVKNPREVLLNFDLDVASMGWDGKELWALPRAVRALETGYNVFTMNFVHGHFLGERRASQESRVFKYADRGYGIRILPSYIDALHDLQARKEEISHGEALHGNVDLEHIAAKALEWVDIFLKEQPQLECERSFSSPGYKWRNRIADTRQEGDTRPHVSHAIMYQVAYKTTEPLNRDCLTSFERLIRHTHLWKKSVTGEIVLDNTEFASTDYDHENAPLGYDDAPALKPFEWNEAFNLKDLETSLNTANKMQHKWITDEWNLEPLGLADRDVTSLNATRRSTFGLSLEEVMAPDADMIIPLLIPADSNIVAWANKMLKDAFREHGLPYDQDPITMPFGKTGDNNKAPNVDEDEEGDGDGEDEDEWRMDRDVQLDVALWRVTALTCWQLIDRRIDEIAEMLWSYHFGYASLRCTDQFRLCTFVSHLSKRAIRDAPDEEFERFARWVGRQQPVRDKEQLAKWQWDMGGASGIPETRKGTFIDYATMWWG
ncbi:hypothetical protein DL93DRAFT_131186 [Clavulina sp. PMI_390]|nr:hypothetical protein DL93DRAFT_131186 [Clavulina sp. PMI_390]